MTHSLSYEEIANLIDSKIDKLEDIKLEFLRVYYVFSDGKNRLGVHHAHNSIDKLYSVTDKLRKFSKQYRMLSASTKCNLTFEVFSEITNKRLAKVTNIKDMNMVNELAKVWGWETTIAYDFIWYSCRYVVYTPKYKIVIEDKTL